MIRERERGTREYLKQFKRILASKADGKKSSSLFPPGRLKYVILGFSSQHKSCGLFTIY
jgi:hypothetical protein